MVLHVFPKLSISAIKEVDVNKTQQEKLGIAGIAYHEAGHAVMARLVKRRFHYVTIDPQKLDQDTGGLVRFMKSKKLDNSLCSGGYNLVIEQYIRVSLAGDVARGIFAGQEEWDLAHSDISGCLFDMHRVNVRVRKKPMHIFLGYYYGLKMNLNS